jgi:hypothetical protein
MPPCPATVVGLPWSGRGIMSLPSEAHVTFELCSFINPDLGEPMTYSRHINSESLSKYNETVDCFSEIGIADCRYLFNGFDQLIFFAHDRILGPIIVAGESSRKDTNGISVFKITFGTSADFSAVAEASAGFLA